MSVSRPRVVVDATVVLKWYFPEIYSEAALELLRNCDICTVDVVMCQVATALGKRVRTGEVKAHEGRQIVNNLGRLPIRTTPAAALASNAIDLSSFSARTFNESMLFILALREQTRVVTADFSWYTMLSTGRLKRYVAFVNRLDFLDDPLPGAVQAAHMQP